MKHIATPLGSRVLIKPAPKKEKSSGGIILVQSEKEPLVEGTIMMVGKDAEELHEGDYVLYSSTAAVDIQVEDYALVLLFEADVWLNLGKNKST